MEPTSTNVLVVEDNPGDAFLVKDYLIQANYNSNNVIIENTLANGLKRLSTTNVGLVLLDLSLPDSNRETTVSNFLDYSENVPVIILSGVGDESIATDALNEGVEDYLIKGKFDSYTLSQSIRYAILRFEHKRKLKELNDFKSKLFRIVSHDLKGPMGALNTYISMMLEDIEEMYKEDLKNDLLSLKDISTSLLNLTENLFNWSRMQFGSIEVKPELLNIYKLVEENITVSKLLAENKNITISNKVSEDAQVFADSDMIRTVLRNLIFNAIKFTNNNGFITIDAKEKNNALEISVSDNGIGMEKELLMKIFENNHAIVREGTNNEKGSGLGLSLCKEFIEHNNGNIWVTSELGKGSYFNFSLPTYNYTKS